MTVDLLKILTASGIEKSALPHAVTTNRTITNPDLGIHRRHIWVDGYETECERTFFVGTPSGEQARMFGVTCEAQDAAAASLRHGVPAADGDRAGCIAVG